MRVALLFATSGYSGVDRVVSNLVPELAGRPHAFDLLTIAGHGPEAPALPANVAARRLPARHRDTVLLPLVRYLRRERPQALLTAGHRLNRVALLARAIARVDCRVTIRFGMTLRGQLEDSAAARAQRLARSMRFWYPRADAVIAPSAGVGWDLRQLAGVAASRLSVIANPIVTERFAALAAEPVDDTWLQGDRPVLLGVGSLEPRKDFATLLRAFAAVRRHRTCRLMILGEGRERARLEALAVEFGVAEDVRLPGHVANPYPYMAQAAAFVLCSRREGSGAVLVEALACGTPSAATDCPSGPREILQDGAVGPLTPMGDAPALAQATARLLEAPPDAADLRAAAAPFAADRAARAYIETVTGCTEALANGANGRPA
jgi:glycosyltransferase involved in cell wall biosynthesis